MKGKGVSESFLQPFDFPTTMFKQIMFILEARHETDPKKYATDVSGFECLMYPFWEHDKRYNKRQKEIEEGNYGTWKTKEEKWEIEALKATEKFKELMSLVSRSGLMPIKQVDWIIHDLKDDGEKDDEESS